jgi:zinc protease
MRSSPACVFLCLAAACAGQSLPQEAIFTPRSFPQQDHQLSSGLRVVVQEDHSTQLVTVVAVYGAGATSDPPEAGGLAHLVEHLTYRARAGEVNRAARLKRAGAVFNGETGGDTTLYYAVGDREALEEMLEIEVARLAAPLEGVTEEDFRIERQVVLNERRQRQSGTTGPAVVGALQERLFPASSPLSRPLMGSEASLALTTLPRAQSFVTQHYRPENCTLVVSGDVDAARVNELMKAWPAVVVTGAGGKPVPHRPPLALTTRTEVAPAALTGTAIIKGPVANRELVLAWSLPGATPENEARLRYVKLALEFVAERHDAQVELAPLADGSMLLVSRTLQPGDDPMVLYHRLRRDLAGEDAIRLAMDATPILQRQARTVILRQIADPVECALQLATHLAATGRASFYRDALNQMLAVTSIAVARTMRTYLRPERAASVLVEPEGVVIAEPADARQVHDLAPTATSNLAGMSAVDVLRVARSPGLGALPRFTLPNGLKVVTVQRRATPLARVDLFIPGGSATEVPYAGLVSELSRTGCRQMVPLSAVGGSAQVDHGKFASHLSITVPDGNLVNALAAVADQARCRELDHRGYQFYRAVVRRLHSLVSPVEASANRAFWQDLYPQHPYGRMTPDPATLDQMTHAEATAYLDAHFRPNAAVTVVTSALPALQVRPLVEGYFADWSRAERIAHVLPPLPPPIPSSRVTRLFPEPRRAQVRLRIGCRLPVNSGAMPALDVVESLIEAQSNELRENWGATYGVSVSVALFPGSAHLTLESAVDSNRVGDALFHLLGLLRRNGTEGPAIEAFTVARWEVARGFNLRFATGGGIARALLLSAQQGWAASDWDRYPAHLAALGPERVQYLMKSCAGHEVVTLIGDIPTLEAQLKGRQLE